MPKEELYDIKISLFWLIYSKEWIIIVVFLWFLIIFFYLLSFYFYKTLTQKDTTETNKNTNTIDNKNYIIQKLDSLRKEIWIIENKVFYKKLDNIIREALYFKYNDKKIFSLTLKELEDNYKDWFIEVLKEIYYLEFNNEFKEIDIEKIIQSLKEII